jgi:2-amino-4-hydroxy-6-hydroxymethyldihydropteridine diphosphokinase
MILTIGPTTARASVDATELPILIGLGANLPAAGYPTPLATLEAALLELERRGVKILRRSAWWESAPVPLSDQPWYVNGVIAVETPPEPEPLLRLLHGVEAGFGRHRRIRDEARVLDLDLLAYRGRVRTGPEPPILPHPRLSERAFVLLPLAEIQPDWRHPATGETLAAMIRRLPEGQICRPLSAPGRAPAEGAAKRPRNP